MVENNNKKDRSLTLPQDLLVPKGDALLIELAKHIKKGGKVIIYIEGKQAQTVTTEDVLFNLTAPYTNQ